MEALGSTNTLTGHGSPDHENVPLASVPRWIKLGSRRWSQVGLTEHSEEAKGEAHPQGRTEGTQAGGDGAEMMKEQR